MWRNKLLFGSLLLLVSSCYQKEDKLFGQWQMTEAKMNEVTFAENQLDKTSIVFDESGNYTSIQFGKKEVGTYKSDGRELIMESQTFKSRPPLKVKIDLLNDSVFIYSSHEKRNEFYAKFKKLK